MENKKVLLAGRIWRAPAYISLVLMTCNVSVIILNIIMRRFFNAPIFGSTEIVKYLSLSTASFVLADNEWTGGNVSMTVIVDAFPARMKKQVMLVMNVIVSVALVIISYLLCNQAVNKYIAKSVTMELRFPVWIPAIVIALGFCFLTIATIIKTVMWGWMIKSGETIDFVKLRRDF